MGKTTVSVAHGDGIGPEIMDATLKILDAAGADLDFQEINIGKTAFESGHSTGIAPEAWEQMRNSKILLKAPITTPQGGGYKSLNVTLRKSMSLFANIRPVKTYTPFIKSHFSDMDLVVIRENEEDLYAGIEHRQTPEVVQTLKLISAPGCERIVRYAFEYARLRGRKKVTCMTKDNIMKQADGLFHEVFDRIAKEYPDIENDHYIIDIGSALIAAQPNRFDVIVTLNLYGDIISDITAQIAGSVGIGGSSNVGEHLAMFEAIHGSAPDIAGKGIANPSGLLNGACMMLQHIGKSEEAARISNAWLRTLESGIHTGDIKNDLHTKKVVGTQEFSETLINNLGKLPEILKPVEPDTDRQQIQFSKPQVVHSKKTLVGVDVFLDWSSQDRDPQILGKKLEDLIKDDLTFALKLITNRGVKVYPDGLPETFISDHWRCRFVHKEKIALKTKTGKEVSAPVSYQSIVSLLNRLASNNLNFIKIENLYEFDGKRAYSLAQGE